jgi:hypothetical protein
MMMMMSSARQWLQLKTVWLINLAVLYIYMNTTNKQACKYDFLEKKKLFLFIVREREKKWSHLLHSLCGALLF